MWTVAPDGRANAAALIAIAAIAKAPTAMVAMKWIRMTVMIASRRVHRKFEVRSRARNSSADPKPCGSREEAEGLSPY